MKDSVNRASFDFSRASLSTPFGVELALKKTGMSLEELTALVGTYKRGPRKGLLKGVLCWAKCTHGGWHRTGRYDHDGGGGTGFVCRYAGLCFSFGIIVEKFRERSEWKWGSDWTGGWPDSFDNDLAKAVENKNDQIRNNKQEVV